MQVKFITCVAATFQAKRKWYDFFLREETLFLDIIRYYYYYYYY